MTKDKPEHQGRDRTNWPGHEDIAQRRDDAVDAAAAAGQVRTGDAPEPEHEDPERDPLTGAGGEDHAARPARAGGKVILPGDESKEALRAKADDEGDDGAPPTHKESQAAEGKAADIAEKKHGR